MEKNSRSSNDLTFPQSCSLHAHGSEGLPTAVFVLQVETHFFLIKVNTIPEEGRLQNNIETGERNRSQPGITSKNHTTDRILKKKSTELILAFTSRIKLRSRAGEK